MFKRLLSTILAISMLFMMSVSGFATENIDYSAMPLNELSALMGISASEVQDLKSRSANDEKFNAEIERYFWALVPPSATPRAKMTPDQWGEIKKVLKPGSILVTKDATKQNPGFGHTAIVYDSLYTVENLGYANDSGTVTGFSTKEKINWWKDHYTCKVVQPNSSTYMTKAANYAYLHLQGIPYAVLCSRYVDDLSNCSSLVWKAYYQTGYNIDPDGNNWDTIYPRNIVESRNTSLVKAVNWSGTW